MKLWAVTDGAAGNARQALALAEALAQRLDAAVEPVVVVGRYPWRAAAPRALHGAARHFDPTFMARLRADQPDLVVGCGRVSALATRLARECSSGPCRAVQILDPRLPGPHWDARVVPEHDSHRDARTVTCVGSLHPVDDRWLAEAGQAWRRQEGGIEVPQVALLLGGPTRRARWTSAQLQSWLRSVADWPGVRNNLWVIGSRRTPTSVRRWLRQQDEIPLQRLWLDHSDGPNPYPAALSLAARLVVSPDSVNMLTEAAATRAHVFVPSLGVLKGRQRRFVDALAQVRVLQELDASGAEAGNGARPEPWRELPTVVDRLLALLNLA